jgi:hypothetical protein
MIVASRSFLKVFLGADFVEDIAISSILCQEIPVPAVAGLFSTALLRSCG